MKVNLTDPTSQAFCCGTLCDKQKAQAHIDRMQRLIDGLYEYHIWGNVPDHIVDEMKSELRELATKD